MNTVLVWMFHSWSLDNKMNRIHEKALRIIYNDRPSSFKELLHEDNYVTMHHKIIRNLAFETIKFLHGLSTLILNEVFVEQDCDYNLGSINFLNRRRIKSVRYATKSVLFLAPKICDILPKKIKDSKMVNNLKAKFKIWVPRDCPCRLCKIYVLQVGFI